MATLSEAVDTNYSANILGLVRKFHAQRQSMDCGRLAAALCEATY